MGKSKLKKLVPQAWFTNIRKEEDSKTNSKPYTKRPSQSKRLFGAYKNKQSSPHYIANDTHFSSTPKRSSPKAICREEPPAMPTFEQPESLDGGSDPCAPTGPALPQSLYKCTMSPGSRKICAGILDDEQSFKIDHSNMMSASCLGMSSKKKGFHLDVQELEAKLKALNSQDRLENFYMSPLFSVAVPSPSLNDEPQAEYSTYGSLGASLRYSLERLEFRKILQGNCFYEDNISTSSVSFSPYSSSSSGTCISKKASRSTNWERKFNYNPSDNEFHDPSITTIDQAHSLLQKLSCRGQNSTQTRDGEAKYKQVHGQVSPTHDSPNSFCSQRNCRTLRKFSERRDGNTSVYEEEGGLGSKICTLEVEVQFVPQNTQTSDVAKRRSPLLQKASKDGATDQSRPLFPNPYLSGLNPHGHFRHTKSYTDEYLSLSDSELACRNYSKFKMMQKDKRSIRELLFKGDSHEKELRSHDTLPFYEDDHGFGGAKTQLLKSSSTRLLDSSPYSLCTGPTMEPSSLHAGVIPSRSYRRNPFLSESSGNKFVDVGMDTLKGSSKIFSHANQPFLDARNGFASQNGHKFDKKEVMRAGSRDQVGHEKAQLITTTSVSKAGTTSHGLKAANYSPHPHRSCMGSKDHHNISPAMHLDKLYYYKSPMHSKSTCTKRSANFPDCAHQNRPSAFSSASRKPICTSHEGIYRNHNKKMRQGSDKFRAHRNMKLSKSSCRSLKCCDHDGLFDIGMQQRHCHDQFWSSDKDMRNMCGCSADNSRRRSSSSKEISDHTASSEMECVKNLKDIKEIVCPSFSWESTNRRPLGEHLTMCSHQSQGNGQHHYVCSASAPAPDKLGRRGSAPSTRSLGHMIRMSTCQGEEQEGLQDIIEELEGSMINERSCSHGQLNNNDVETGMIRRRSCSRTSHQEDTEAKMIGWRSRCSNTQFDVKDKELSSMIGSADYHKNVNDVCILGRRSCSGRVQSDLQAPGAKLRDDTDIKEKTTEGRRRCSSPLQIYRVPCGSPTQSEEDRYIDERVIGQRSCSGSTSHSENSTRKFCQHFEKEKRMIEKKRCSRLPQYYKPLQGGEDAESMIRRMQADEGADMISREKEIASRIRLQEESGYEKEGMRRGSCGRGVSELYGRYSEEEEEEEEEEVKLQAKVMWSYNLRQDFRESMRKVLDGVHVRHADQEGGARVKQEVLECYLALNPPSHHHSILCAFRDLCCY